MSSAVGVTSGTITLGGRAQTLAWARRLGSMLFAGDFIALVGDLGAGKTTITAGIAKGMRIAEPVTSPTFALIQEYHGKVPMYHFDVYRLDGPEALYSIGYRDYFYDPGVIVMEWADRVEDVLPFDRLTIEIESPPDQPAEDGSRILTLTASGESWPDRLPALLAFEYTEPAA